MNKLAFAPRVHQLEAAFIDLECLQILQTLLDRALALAFRGASVIAPELNLAIDFLYYRFTVAKDTQLPGHMFQNIKLAMREGSPLTSRAKLLYFVFFVLGKYGWTRFTRYAEREARSKVVRLLQFLYKSAAYLYFLYWLGAFKPSLPYSLLLWLAGMAFVQPKSGISRELDFELLNRTLVWDTLAGCFKFVVGSGALRQLQKLFFVTSFLGSLDSRSSETGCYICKEETCAMPVKLEPC